MIALLAIVVLVPLVGCCLTLYLLGFRLGGTSTLEELTRVRTEAAQASRQIESLTRQALTAMLDEARRQRGDSRA
jgi:hypothetical protein